MSDAPQNATPLYARTWAQGFLAALSLYGNVTEAAQLTGIDRKTAYRYRSDDAEFAEAWDDALQQFADLLEAEARRRAMEGVDKPVFQGGIQVGVVREYSDSLMLAMLKAKRPDQYRERVTNDNFNHDMSKEELEKLPQEELEKLAGGKK